ncbi:MAG: hypothetical protein ABWZ42_09530 [Ilumatobacteraceae bacterium]
MSVRYPTSSIESHFVGHGLLAADAGSSRLVYAMVFALIIIGVVLIVLAIVVFRRTRVDLDVLAPLERMGSRKWRKADPESRRQLLDAVRPAGATGPSLTDSADAPVGLPPPVVEPASEAPHDATFIAGPDGVEPVEHLDEPVQAVADADETITAPDDVAAAPEPADAASANAPDDGGAPPDDGVVEPAASPEPVDGSVTGQ